MTSIPITSVVVLIEKLKTKPAMYLGDESITRLKSFLDGWFLGIGDSVMDEEVLADFQIWIAERFNLKTTHSWDRIILFYSMNEQRALFSFFELFSSFLEEKGDSSAP